MTLREIIRKAEKRMVHSDVIDTDARVYEVKKSLQLLIELENEIESRILDLQREGTSPGLPDAAKRIVLIKITELREVLGK